MPKKEQPILKLPGLVLVSRYDDCMAVLQQHERFFEFGVVDSHQVLLALHIGICLNEGPVQKSAVKVVTQPRGIRRDD
jgi:hypothetical protein